MGLDALLKRYFPAVVCILVGIAAYFQASGMGELVAAAVAPDPSEIVPPAQVGPRRPATSSPSGASASSTHSTDAAPILARNPFDSVTGPLDGSSLELDPNLSVSAPPDSADPYQDPICDGAKVLLITASDDPEWSFAAFAQSGGGSILRRQGDDVGGAKVHYVGWDRVWMMQGGSRCQAPVGGKEVPKATAAKPAEPAEKKPRSRRGAAKIPDELASKIHKTGENRYDIERSAVDYILENQSDFMKAARIVPEKEGNKVVGIRMFGIRPDSLLGTLGLQNGDRLQSINGFEMSDPQKALEAYARLRTADKLTVVVNRRGKEETIDFNIK